MTYTKAPIESNCELNRNQVRASEKGLTFCLSPCSQNKYEIWNDIKELHRRRTPAAFQNHKLKVLKLTYHKAN